MSTDQDRLMVFLQAVADCEPCAQAPHVDGVDDGRRHELLVGVSRMGWVNLRTFLGDGTLPPGEVLRLTAAGRAALRDAIARQDSNAGEGSEISVPARRQRRALVMQAVYELSDGSTTKLVSRDQITQQVGWNQDAVMPVVRYLVDKQLLRYESWGGGVCLTAHGVDEVEEAAAPQSHGTEHLAGLQITTGDMSGGVIQVVQGEQGSARNESNPTGRSHRGLWNWLAQSTWTVVLAAAGILLAGAVTAIIATSSGDSHRPSSSSGSGATTGLSSGTAGKPAALVSGARVVEYADNRSGSSVYASPEFKGVAGLPARIPYGTPVLVRCEVPNQVASVTSVTAFYLIASGRWRGDYVVSDTMSNGGSLGNTDTPNVDPKVPRCH